MNLRAPQADDDSSHGGVVVRSIGEGVELRERQVHAVHEQHRTRQVERQVRVEPRMPRRGARGEGRGARGEGRGVRGEG